MPLQNRVNPFGELCAFCARGLFMGNRGGRFHTDTKPLTRRRWASRQWICCVLEFKGRRRDVWSSSYTELFFLDEPTAFAAAASFTQRLRDAAHSVQDVEREDAWTPTLRKVKGKLAMTASSASRQRTCSTSWRCRCAPGQR